MLGCALVSTRAVHAQLDAPPYVASLASNDPEQRDWDDGFLFIHVSDAHVWDQPEEVIAFLELDRPWWIPRAVFGWFALRIVASRLPVDESTIANSLRRALVPYYEGDVEELWDSELLPAYIEEVRRPGSPLGDGESRVREAFAEVAAHQPAFIVNTGDIVLDSTWVPLDISDRWMRLYREVSEAGGFPVYNTIGNHGLGGIHRDASPDDPDYGPGFFHQRLGPSFYSFDRGGLHFVALDTHHPPPAPGLSDETEWAINRTRPEVSSWLEADLAKTVDQVRVVMNHEPFRVEPTWPFPETYVDTDLVSDEALARHGVAYALTGHAHLPALGEQNGVMNIQTGALSGIFWLMPLDLQRGGYRMIYAYQGRLYSAWKELDQPLLTFAEPPSLEGHLVIVAADRAGPMARVRVQLDGKPLGHETWGDYFLRVRISADKVSRVIVYGETREGETLRLVGDNQVQPVRP